jgi:hypothetical protein
LEEERTLPMVQGRNVENRRTSECDNYRGSVLIRGYRKENTQYLLLLQVILSRTAGLTTRERTPVFLLACVDFGMAKEVAACCECFLAQGTEVISFGEGFTRHSGEAGGDGD